MTEKLHNDYLYDSYVGERLTTGKHLKKKRKTPKKSDHAHDYEFVPNPAKNSDLAFHKLYVCVHCGKEDYRFSFDSFIKEINEPKENTSTKQRTDL